ncbi:AraC family transcriptional regulator [Zunongwangia sp. F363]|uniref:AraC family transcriptional regulator n=1 Tax=Autumnicola tepida TaxID=3075595 RepID=A0ABU3CDV2_9FLAO|nr:AraC family transcriptional regulator [Zunongwangia sp. F363]MDT0644520.1 AraC family transcriptional regulator [Zunongwangia sp. F363]
MDHLDESLKPLYEIAALHNTNEHKIKTGFKKVFGSTPNQYHREQRIERSKILIENTDLSLSEIAQKMGFASYPAFSKTFKQLAKVTPRKYSKSTRNS